LLGDRGFSVNALARLASTDRPAVLGALSSEGEVAEERALVWTWRAPLALDIPDASVDATLFTGAGDRLVPRGLVLGRAWLPAQAREPIEIRLREFADGASLNEVWVFRGSRAEQSP
jgi:hypothetical protein